MNYEQIKQKIIEWAKERGIFENSNAIKQISKTQEELDETLQALQHLGKREDAMADVVDGIGDMLVTIIILSEILGVDSVDCLTSAYEEIKDRKGKMVDGLFMKEK